MPRTRINRERIKAAIPGSGGIIAHIARQAGYSSWGAVRDYIRADEELAAMVRDEEETVDDLAEATVITKIKNGDEGSAKWWLARRRRERFGDNVDVTSGGEKIEIVVKYAEDKPDLA